MPSRGTRRVAMLTPFAFPSPSGNAVTVERIASGLSTREIEPRVWDLSAGDAATVEREVCQARPGLAARIVVIAQSVSFRSSDGPPPPRAAGPVMLLPAGIRPVKRPLMPLGPLDAVAARHEGFELHYVGPVLDAEEGAKLFLGLAGRPWCRYLGAVPHARMPALLSAADVVVNCSISEGGMSNSVLEALTLGRAVLASDIEGNRALIEEGVTGLLFSDASALASQAERLLDDVELCARLGAEGQSRAAGF